jgi:GTP:adenosylcobinamide-phosphate guanylyltransferase
LLVELAGRPVIDWTLKALTEASLERLLLVGPSESVVSASEPLRGWLERADVDWLAPAAGPAASAVCGADALGSYPLLLTAADHALLRPQWIDTFVAQAQRLVAQEQADLVVGLVPYALVAARFPESKRTVLRFADGGMCGSNLFLLATPKARLALQYWQQVESLRKSPMKLAAALGWRVCLGYLSGRLTRADVLRRLSELAGCRITACLLDEPVLAVDVDSVADLALAERELMRCNPDV